MQRFILILFFSLFLSGCFTPVTNIEDYKVRLADKNLRATTIDGLLKEVFTDEAYEAIKDIPMESGNIGTAMAAGSSIPSSIMQFFIGGGIGRKVLFNHDFFMKTDQGYGSIIHEYMHHLDDITRDGKGDFINLREFEVGYATCWRTMMYAGICMFVESAQGDWVTDTFGIGPSSERMAYTAQVIWKQDCPPLLKYAYRKIFRRFQNATLEDQMLTPQQVEFLEQLRAE